MISFISNTTGTRVQLRQGPQLSESPFGSIHLLNDLRNQQTQFVCKTINLNLSNHPLIDRKTKLKGILNEIKVLKQLGFLEGYNDDNDQFYIVMKLIEGVPGFNSDHFDKNYLNFKALRDLHRKGFALFNCHSNNFIIDDFEGKSTISNFKSAKENTFFNTAIDLCSFCIVNDLTDDLLDFRPLFELYVREMVEHAIEHKYQTVGYILLLGAITIAAISGVPALAITHIMVQNFLKMLLVRQITKEINSEFIPNILAQIIGLAMDSFGYHVSDNTMKNIKAATLIAQSCLSLYFTYSNIAYYWQGSGSFINEGLDSIQNKAWHSIFANATPEVLINTAGMYFTITELWKHINNCADRVLPESALKLKADFFYKHPPLLYAKAALTKVKEVAGYEYQVPLRLPHL